MLQVLRHLYDRQLPGEEVWLATLAKDVGVLVEDVKFVLKSQDLGSWLSQQRGWDLVTIKDAPLLSRKLLDIGVDPESLQSMQALFRGAFRAVRQLRDPKLNELGQLTVEAVWTSKEPPSRVFWQDLNASARQTVSTSSSFQCFITDLTCFRLQVVEKLNVQPSEADDIEPEPEHQVNRVVGRRKGSGGVWLNGIEWKGPDGAWPEISYERFDELDDVCQQMASNAFGPNAATERWKAKARGKQKKKRKGPKLSQRSARKAAQKQRGHKQHQSGTGKGKSRAKQIFEDEALELARQFSGEESVSFINGILDAVHKG